jgi:hypothetical protein
MWALLNSAGAVTALANWAPAGETGWTQIAPDDPRVTAFLAQAPTMIGAYDFINRFAASEQQAILEASVAAGGWQIALWLHQLAASGTVDVTATAVTNGMGSLVSGGLLTAARSAQILNLGTASP